MEENYSTIIMKYCLQFIKPFPTQDIITALLKSRFISISRKLIILLCHLFIFLYADSILIAISQIPLC